MSDTLVAETPVLSPRRFQLPDFSEHGGWIVDRLRQAHKHLDERTAFAWLRSLLNSNEHLFLYHGKAVCVAELVRGATLAPKPVIVERFVWCRDRKDKEAQRQALSFYEDMRRWAKGFGADTIIVGEASDVDIEAIKGVFGGRSFSRVQNYVKV